MRLKRRSRKVFRYHLGPYTTRFSDTSSAASMKRCRFCDHDPTKEKIDILCNPRKRTKHRRIDGMRKIARVAVPRAARYLDAGRIDEEVAVELGDFTQGFIDSFVGFDPP